ncbi:hypothetical protein FOA43_001850 [Brettanomyces nanus]|uniref:Uncharacterized protein n=1 Tax=Eeniella nana TaxID=13502 RepID=A0A875RP33_EENNA|nr:uncharacterized protein FOA43_001850 [Brettanomyces nanus]QPG74520.1 hypothetical protein FOA43_001850 [Brettanomyces nanus]
MTSRLSPEGGSAAFTPFENGGVLISTADEISGHVIIQNIGLVFGSTVRSRNIGANIGASFKSIIGGELKPLTKNVVNSRDQAIERMIKAALSLGANGIVAFRFDSGSIGEGMTEICCYGSAVKTQRKA